MRKIKILLLLLLFLAQGFPAQNGLSEQIDSVLAATDGLSKISARIIDADNGSVIYEKNPALPVIPASTVKLFTTAAALDFLGKDFPLSVRAFFTAEPQNGVLDGDVIVKGYSNPFFKTKDLDSLVSLIFNAGVRKITGNIIADDSYLDENYFREHWIKRERSEVGTPPVSAIVLNRNEIEIIFKPARNKKPPFVFGFRPESDFFSVNFNAKLTTRRAVPRLTIKTRPKKFSVTVGGKIRRRNRTYSYKFFADNPPLFLANILYEKLEKKGIEITGSPKAAQVTKGTYLISETVTKLESVVEKANKESDNFLAELIFKTLGAEYCGCSGNSFYALQAVNDFMERKNINAENVLLVDGSGISRQNRLTANAVTELLTAMYYDEENFNVFYSSLAFAGVDGTLEERLTGFGLKNNFHGKTGTLNGVSALSGYFTTRNGKNVIVSILMNFYKHGAEYWREVQDEIIVRVSTDY